ncbi:hypothetical protein LTR37_006224 [Vermiconidia calcicola]|uniref:Uncharacterized protein n=1 Tax=Vermiconidia calcicola TaxID=1690605 RepID=A0ACC3NHH4_9PEZI|nr:hypothetical protein LTR37_006224 [Vermiconidia calcicola]
MAPPSQKERRKETLGGQGIPRSTRPAPYKRGKTNAGGAVDTTSDVGVGDAEHAEVATALEGEGGRVDNTSPAPADIGNGEDGDEVDLHRTKPAEDVAQRVVVESSPITESGRPEHITPQPDHADGSVEEQWARFPKGKQVAELHSTGELSNRLVGLNDDDWMFLLTKLKAERLAGSPLPETTLSALIDIYRADLDAYHARNPGFWRRRRDHTVEDEPSEPTEDTSPASPTHQGDLQKQLDTVPPVSADEDVRTLSRAQKIQDFLDATWRELVRLEPYGEGALLLGFAYGMIALEGSLQAVDKGYKYICVVAPYVRGGAEHVRVGAGYVRVGAGYVRVGAEYVRLAAQYIHQTWPRPTQAALNDAVAGEDSGAMALPEGPGPSCQYSPEQVAGKKRKADDMDAMSNTIPPESQLNDYAMMERPQLPLPRRKNPWFWQRLIYYIQDLRVTPGDPCLFGYLTPSELHSALRKMIQTQDPSLFASNVGPLTLEEYIQTHTDSDVQQPAMLNRLSKPQEDAKPPSNDQETFPAPLKSSYQALKELAAQQTARELAVQQSASRVQSAAAPRPPRSIHNPLTRLGFLLAQRSNAPTGLLQPRTPGLEDDARMRAGVEDELQIMKFKDSDLSLALKEADDLEQQLERAERDARNTTLPQGKRDHANHQANLYHAHMMCVLQRAVGIERYFISSLPSFRRPCKLDKWLTDIGSDKRSRYRLTRYLDAGDLNLPFPAWARPVRMKGGLEDEEALREAMRMVREDLETASSVYDLMKGAQALMDAIRITELKQLQQWSPAWWRNSRLYEEGKALLRRCPQNAYAIEEARQFQTGGLVDEFIENNLPFEDRNWWKAAVSEREDYTGI